MHDLGAFRANMDAIAARLATRGVALPLGEYRQLDVRRRAAITESEQLQADKNRQSKEIGALRKAGADTSELEAKSRTANERIAELKAQVEELDAESIETCWPGSRIRRMNLCRRWGRSAEDNVVLRAHGTPGTYSFPPKAHWELGPELGILDFDRAGKITGARFAVYIGLGAKLERALINFMLDTHTAHHGYTEVLPPFMVNSASLYGTGNLPKFAEDLFKLEKTDYWLIPTAEVPVTNLFRDETLDGDKLPIKLCAYTPCFPQRGPEVVWARCAPGIIRQHQFQKVETREVRASGSKITTNWTN